MNSFEVTVFRRHRYRVHLAPGTLARFGELLAAEVGRRSVVVLSDRRVHRLYGPALTASLDDAAIPHQTLLVPEGERSKSMATYSRLLDRLAEIGCQRRCVIVNLGGGVISDLGGFLASSYMRGIDYVNLSTTLLGQLDASLGGKVAVNSPRAKNLVGAFHHPIMVVSDPTVLRTLALRDYRSGMAEAIKVAIISDPELFQLLEEDRTALLARDPDTLTRVIGRAGKGKMDLIDPDPYEDDLKRPLNFGHTIGHPLETEFGYRRVRHGDAVAIGMGVATAIARRRGLISPANADRIFRLLDRYDLLDLGLPIQPHRLLEHVRYVRMIRGGHLWFVMPREIGRVEIADQVSDGEFVLGFEAYNEVIQERTMP